ncbi:MAG: hypothetical protein FWG21_06090, partial [Oscillospiraceae bacterium]|nr:hypothetical protein [Oscillospiraceae bacterium]
MRKIKICDTTLRDCEHFGEFFMSVREKVEIAKQLERLGVDIIEVSVLSDAILEVAKELTGVVFSVACTLFEYYDIDVQAALSVAETSRVNLLCHESRDLGFLDQLKGIIIEAKDKGYLTQVTFDALSMADDYLLKDALNLVTSLNVDSICIYENMGYMTANELTDIIDKAITRYPDTAFSVKCKNDLGLAVANTLAAIKSGVSAVECSIGGLGVRAGNTALEQVVMALSARSDYYEVSTNIVKRLIHRTHSLVSTVTGQTIHANKPIVGSKALDRYETSIVTEVKFSAINPEEIGIIRNNLVLGANTSPSVFRERIDDLGYLLSKENHE